MQIGACFRYAQNRLTAHAYALILPAHYVRIAGRLCRWLLISKKRKKAL